MRKPALAAFSAFCIIFSITPLLPTRRPATMQRRRQPLSSNPRPHLFVCSALFWGMEGETKNLSFLNFFLFLFFFVRVSWGSGVAPKVFHYDDQRFAPSTSISPCFLSAFDSASSSYLCVALVQGEVKAFICLSSQGVFFLARYYWGLLLKLANLTHGRRDTLNLPL